MDAFLFCKGIRDLKSLKVIAIFRRNEPDYNKALVQTISDIEKLVDLYRNAKAKSHEKHHGFNDPLFFLNKQIDRVITRFDLESLHYTSSMSPSGQFTALQDIQKISACIRDIYTAAGLSVSSSSQGLPVLGALVENTVQKQEYGMMNMALFLYSAYWGAVSNCLAYCGAKSRPKTNEVLEGEESKKNNVPRRQVEPNWLGLKIVK